MIRKFALPIAGVMLLLTGGSDAAEKDDNVLQGDYAFTGEAACLIAPNGFTNDLTPINDNASQISFSVQGTRTFNGDGTGTVQGRAIVINPPPAAANTAPSGSSQDFSYDFTYEIAADGTITTHMVPGTYLGTFLTGTRAGQSYTIDHFSLSGVVSKDKRAITLTTATTEVETHTFSNGQVLPRICHRARSLIRIR